MAEQQLEIRLHGADTVDRAAWDAHVIATSGNPTQLAAFGGLGGAMRRPLFIEVWRGDAVVLRWLVYRAGPPGLRFIDIHSEPTTQAPELVGPALDAAIRRIGPFRVQFHDMVFSRWRSADDLAAIGLGPAQRYGTVCLDLAPGPEALRAAMHKKQRASVNKGAREGLELVEASTPDAVARLAPIIEQTLARGGGAAPNRAHIAAHAEALCPAGHGRIFFARRNGEDLGAAFKFVTPTLALGWLGGTRDDAPPTTGNFLQWSIIEKLSDEGVAAYDLGGVDLDAAAGSKGANILRSKQRYGGEVTEHCGATLTRGRLRGLAYDTLMKLRG